MLNRLGNKLKERHEKMRKKEPWRFVDQTKEVLTITDVAGLLHCSVNSIYHIPKTELPTHMCAGKNSIYLREEVLAYIRSKAPKTITNLADEFSSGTPEKTNTKNVVSFDAANALRELKGKTDG